MHKRIKRLILEQIRLRLQLVDDEVKKSKVQSIIKHCVHQIANYEPRRYPNRSFLRFGKPLIYVCNINIIFVLKLVN